MTSCHFPLGNNRIVLYRVTVAWLTKYIVDVMLRMPDTPVYTGYLVLESTLLL